MPQGQKKARRIESRTVLLLEREGKFAVAQRPRRGLLAGLWELPNYLGEKTRREVLALCRAAGLSVKSARRMNAARHIFTHIEWNLSGWHVRLADTPKETARESPAVYDASPLPPLTWATQKELSDTYSIPAAFHAYLPAP